MRPVRRHTRLRERLTHGVKGFLSRPWWELAALAAIVALTAFLYTWTLSRNGMGNSYYAAAVKSGSISWKAFLFGSLDPGNFITVDKTPAAFWIPGLSARIFGFSSWSILLPQALAGVGSVLVLYHLVRRWQGPAAALLASLAFALTPVVLLMFRYNNPDAFLTLLLLLCTWAFWSALEKESGWRLALSGALMGFAFLTKMLEAFLVLPAFVVVYLACAKPRFWRRVVHLLGASIALVLASGWWIALVELWPTASRPYIGGSTDNSVLDLILSRTAGYTSGAGLDGAGGAAPPGGGGPGFAGTTGWLRIFNEELGGQIAWLLPPALLGLLAGLWVTRSGRRTDLKRAGYLLWGIWTVVMVLVFDFAGGVLHPYYAIILGPGIAALFGAGSLVLWKLGRDHLWLAWLLPAGVAGSAVLSAVLLRRTPDFAPGLDTAVLVLGMAGATVLLLATLLLRRSARPRVTRAYRGLVTASTGTAVLFTCLALLGGPVAYDLYTVSHSITGGLAAAGPPIASTFLGRSSIPVDAPGGPLDAPPPPGPGAGGTEREGLAYEGLAAYLQAEQGSAGFLVAVQGAHVAAPLIIATGEPVVAMGGFSGGDPAPTLEEFKELVAAGQVRYVLLTQAGPSVPGVTIPGNSRPAAGASPPYLPPPGAPPGQQQDAAQERARQGSLQSITQFVVQTGQVVPASSYGGSGRGVLYYLGR